MNGLLTINEVCKRLKVSRVTIYDWMNSGKLKAIKFGKGVRIREEDVEALGQEWKSEKKKTEPAAVLSPSDIESLKMWRSTYEDMRSIVEEMEISSNKFLEFGELLRKQGRWNSKAEAAVKRAKLNMLRGRKSLEQLERVINQVEEYMMKASKGRKG
jgi:excisionase family DNA binding protein